MPPGKVRGALGLEAGGGFDTVSLVPSASVRVGVAPRTEVRGKISANFGADIGLNVQVVDGETLDLMVMPTYHYADADDFFDEHDDRTEVMAFGLPVVVDIALSESGQHSVFIGPDLRAGRAEYIGGFAAVGAHVGLAIGGPNGYGSFLPECAFFALLTEGDPLEGDSRGLVNCSLGVSFGQSQKTKD